MYRHNIGLFFYVTIKPRDIFKTINVVTTVSLQYYFSDKKILKFKIILIVKNV